MRQTSWDDGPHGLRISRFWKEMVMGKYNQHRMSPDIPSCRNPMSTDCLVSLIFTWLGSHDSRHTGRTAGWWGFWTSHPMHGKGLLMVLLMLLSIRVMRRITCQIVDSHIEDWLVAWNIFIFHNIWDVILPIDFHIFQDGYCTTNQGNSMDI